MRAGVPALQTYCLERGLAYVEVGKVLVALDVGDDRLHAIHAQAEANGMPGLRWLGPDQLTEVEPHVAGRAALHSPTTAIVDYAQIADALLRDASSEPPRCPVAGRHRGARHRRPGCG